MKKLRKIGCVLLGAVMAFGLTACGDPADNGDGDDGKGGSISIHYTVGGFGKTAYEKLGEDYKALTGVSVSWTPSYSTGEIQNLLTSNQEKNDIVLPLLNMYQAQDGHYLEDLTDVYNATYTGETVAVKDKINATLYEYIEAKDGKRYQLFGNDSVSAFCYNADTLDEAFGEGNWTLPRTTDELFKMGDDLKTKGYYTFSAATSINYNWDYIGTVWWAQYDGLEAFNNFYWGKYYDAASNEWKKGTAINDTAGRREAMTVMSRMMSNKNGYMHSYSDRMSFEDAQAAFLGNGYSKDTKKVAFMVNGDWLENEMASWLLENPQDIGMMRAPVISSLASKLSTVQTDAKLAEVVAAVDEGKTEVAGVSAEDFTAVKTARLMGYTATPNYPIGIPAYRPENKKKLAKDFLVYMYSDRAQKILSQEWQGLTYPTSYVPEDSAMSNFVKSRRKAFGNDMIPVFPRNASPMVYRGGMGDMSGVSGPDSQFYKGTTVDTILETVKTSLDHNWATYLEAEQTSTAGQGE